MAPVVLIYNVLSKQVRSKPSGDPILKSRQLILRPNNLCPNKIPVLLTTVAVEFYSPFIACHTAGISYSKLCSHFKQAIYTDLNGT